MTNCRWGDTTHTGGDVCHAADLFLLKWHVINFGGYFWHSVRWKRRRRYKTTISQTPSVELIIYLGRSYYYFRSRLASASVFGCEREHVSWRTHGEMSSWSTYADISHVGRRLAFTSPVSVRRGGDGGGGGGGGDGGGGAGQHPGSGTLLAKRGAAVAGTFTRRIVRERGEEGW